MLSSSEASWASNEANVLPVDDDDPDVAPSADETVAELAEASVVVVLPGSADAMSEVASVAALDDASDDGGGPGGGPPCGPPAPCMPDDGPPDPSLVPMELSICAMNAATAAPICADPAERSMLVSLVFVVVDDAVVEASAVDELSEVAVDAMVFWMSCNIQF